MATRKIETILPNHGDPERLAAGGYGTGLITATQHYIDRLLRVEREPALRRLSLPDFIHDELEAGWISYFPPYAAVHDRAPRRHCLLRG